MQAGPKAVLYVDHSDESAEIRRELEGAGAQFDVVFAFNYGEIPALVTRYGSIRGTGNIRQYLLAGA